MSTPVWRALNPGLVAFAIALGCLIAAPAEAAAQASATDTLAAGRDAYLEAEFEGAVAQFTATLNQPDATAAQLGEAHLYLATLHSMLGDEALASRHARAAVALDPEASVPEGAPEEVETLLRSAREANGDRTVSVSLDAEHELAAGTEGRLSATLLPDGLPFVSTLRLRCEGPGEPVEAESAPPSVQLDVTPAAGEFRCRSAALTEGGAELAGAQRSWSFASDDAGSDDTLLIGLLSGGAGLLVLTSIIVIVAVVASGGTQDQAQLGPPTVEGW